MLACIGTLLENESPMIISENRFFSVLSVIFLVARMLINLQKSNESLMIVDLVMLIASQRSQHSTIVICQNMHYKCITNQAILRKSGSRLLSKSCSLLRNRHPLNSIPADKSVALCTCI